MRRGLKDPSSKKQPDHHSDGATRAVSHGEVSMKNHDQDVRNSLANDPGRSRVLVESYAHEKSAES